MKPLLDSDAFGYLKELVTEKRDETVNRFAKAILANGKLDAEKVLYHKAFWDGAMSVLETPENVEAAFNRMLKRLDEQGSDA